MSRFRDFAQFDDRQYEDVDAILQSDGKTCDVYRLAHSGEPGFSDEVGAEARVKRMLVLLFRQPGATRATAEGGITSTKVSFIGLCVDDDVRKDDIWLVEGKRYKVFDVDKGSKGKVETRLELIL